MAFVVDKQEILQQDSVVPILIGGNRH